MVKVRPLLVSGRACATWTAPIVPGTRTDFFSHAGREWKRATAHRRGSL